MRGWPRRAGSRPCDSARNLRPGAAGRIAAPGGPTASPAARPRRGPFAAALSTLALLAALLAAAGAQAQTAPAAPTGLTATARNGSVLLSWRKSSDSAVTKYQYRRGTGTTVIWGAWTDFAGTFASDPIARVITGLTNGTRYSFQVRASAGEVPGAASDVVTATPKAPPPPPAKPTGLTATAGNGVVGLAWADPENSDITAYQYRQRAGGGSWSTWLPIPSSGAGTTAYTVTGLTNGTAYGFQVRALAGFTLGTNSDVVTATPASLAAPEVSVNFLTGEGTARCCWPRATAPRRRASSGSRPTRRRRRT